FFHAFIVVCYVSVAPLGLLEIASDFSRHIGSRETLVLVYREDFFRRSTKNTITAGQDAPPTGLVLYGFPYSPTVVLLYKVELREMV
ncbi:MAG: hypothetical protein OXT74_09735, partial [Candidatus Poribacteria bacterium]|nr:hypothetical protein [Candidatus Poribacteria bacterium]